MRASEEARSDADLLCICCSFRPDTSPTANRAAKLVAELAERGFRVRVITAVAGNGTPEPRNVERITVAAKGGRKALAVLARARLGKVVDLLGWPDPDVVWVPAAIHAALRALSERRAKAIVVFMMPYSSGLIGLVLRRLTRIPTIFNLDDSPTCTDMHPSFVTPAHRWLARQLEDSFVARSDATIYVSETTRKRVEARLAPPLRQKLHLIRYGGDRVPRETGAASSTFSIRYIGGMNGWHALLEGAPTSFSRALFRRAMKLGVTREVELDFRSSSPIFVGRAVSRVLDRHPEWRGRMRVEVYGNQFPNAVVERALARYDVREVVEVHGTVSHAEAVRLSASAELLFLTLPARLDGSAGGRISAKTYEYLTTDRAILAAVPAGENRLFLEGQRGVTCCDPLDEAAMAQVIERSAAAFFAGAPERFDRSELSESLSYSRRTDELIALLESVISGTESRDGASRESSNSARRQVV